MTLRFRWIPAALIAALWCAPFHPALAVGSDQQPGQKIQVDPRALPVPYSPPSRAYRSRTVAKPADATLRVPQGFAVNVFAENLGDARTLKVAPNGDVFLAVSDQNKILVMSDGGGKAKNVKVFAEGFNHPSGLAFTGNALLVSDFDGVWKIPYSPGDEKARAKQIRITPVGALGDPGGHSTRMLAVSPDGSKIYVSVGSRGNIAEEPEPRATIQEFAMDGSRQRTFARGLRNPIGVQFYPGTSDLYTVVNERDTLGDELVPDYLTKVSDGAFYGWPYAYLGTNPQPKFADLRPDLIAKTILPDALFRSHSAPIDFVFYTAKQFPAQYQGGAFVTLRGSWNASTPRGYNVAYVVFKDGKPENAYTVFASGFWTGGDSHAEVWGRPTGIAVAKDGSLLVADDVSGTVWRVSYRGN
jgi:glucose/arabinose dehydrogenase